MGISLVFMSGRQRGAAAVEFAFILPVLLLMLAGIIGFGRILWFYDALAKSTRDAARLLSSADMTSSANVSTAVSNAQQTVLNAASKAGLSGVSTSNLQIRCDDVACSTTKATYVSVAIVNYQVGIGQLFPFMAPGNSGWNSGVVHLSPKTTMRYML